MKARPSEAEAAFWSLADFAVRNRYATCRQIVTIARLAPTRKSGRWRRCTSDLKWFMTWRDQQDRESADEDAEKPR